MANSQDKPAFTLSASKADDQALVRRAAQVARTSQLLIEQTEQLLAQSKQLLKKPGNRSNPK